MSTEYDDDDDNYDIEGSFKRSSSTGRSANLAKSKSVKKVVTKALKKTSDKEYHENFKHSKIGRFYFFFLWGIVTAVMAYYTYQIAIQFLDASPGSTVTFTTLERIYLPQVVVCNWNQEINGPCDTCFLEFNGCSYLVDSSDCSSLWTPVQFHTDYGDFNCYSFNGNVSTRFYSDKTGYAGAYTALFSVNISNTNSIPDPLSSRTGLQVTFGIPEKISPDDIYRENRYAQVGSDTFFSIVTVNTIRNYLDEKNESRNVTRYETTSSAVNLGNAYYPDSVNPTKGYVAVSFSFEIISSQDINYDYGYTLENFWGDWAGMIGTLM